MIISKRKYYCNYFIAMFVVGVLIFMSAPIANKYLFHLPVLNDICRYALITEAMIIITVAHRINQCIKDKLNYMVSKPTYDCYNVDFT